MVDGVEHRAFAGIEVTPMRLDQLMEQVSSALARGTRLSITFLNPDYARRAMLDRQLASDINAFDLVLVDGNGVRLLAPVFGFRVPERLDTDKVAPPVLELLSAQGASVFLFGCAPSVANRAANRLVQEYPRLAVVGIEHGYHDVRRGHPGRFDDEDSKRIVATINASGASCVIVSLPTPLQQRWVVEYRPHLTAGLVITGGSYLDHVAADGALGAAWYPSWVNTLQLNWLYRLFREPRRLWRRYTLDIAHFVALAIRARLRGTGPYTGSQHESPTLSVGDQAGHGADLGDR